MGNHFENNIKLYERASYQSSPIYNNDASSHDNVIKWKHFPRYWPFVRGIHRSPVNSPHKGQWRRALMFSLICVWINGWVNNREAGDLRRYCAHFDVTVMLWKIRKVEHEPNWTERDMPYLDCIGGLWRVFIVNILEKFMIVLTRID